MELIVSQLQYFGVSFLCGGLLMCFYDFLRVFRRVVRHGKAARLFEDWFFWLVAAVLVFQMIFPLNNGVLRSFFILSFIAGMVLYRAVAKERVVRGILAFLSLIFRPYVWIRKKMSGIRKKNLKS